MCLVAAGRGNTIPLKETLDLPDPTWLQFRRRLDKMNPFCRIAGHKSCEVREILAALEIVYRELFPQLNLRRWTGSIYTWLTQPVLDPASSGRVTMDYLMKLVTTALEWTYQAGETDVRAETLEVAASLLVLRRDTLRLIDGAGPDIEAPRSESTEQKQASGTEVEGVSESANPPENPVQAQTLHTDKGDQIPSEHATSHSAVMDQKQPTKSTKCTFSGAVPIDLKRFLESDVALVECPDCAATRTLEPHGGILRAVVSRQTQNGDSCDLEAVGKGENGLGCGGSERASEIFGSSMVRASAATSPRNGGGPLEQVTEGVVLVLWRGLPSRETRAPAAWNWYTPREGQTSERAADGPFAPLLEDEGSSNGWDGFARPRPIPSQTGVDPTARTHPTVISVTVWPLEVTVHEPTCHFTLPHSVSLRWVTGRETTGEEIPVW